MTFIFHKIMDPLPLHFQFGMTALLAHCHLEWCLLLGYEYCKGVSTNKQREEVEDQHRKYSLRSITEEKLMQGHS
jgi:hypothetical protein